MIINNEHFNLHQIADSGQAFRFYPHKEGYILIANHEAVYIREDEGVSFKTEQASVWSNYFDLDKDYKIIADYFIQKDAYLKEAVTFGRGIRILKQDPFEMIVTFIISANNNIKRITSAIEKLCQRYGDELNTIDGIKCYDFPRPEQLYDLSIEDFRDLGVGYRDRYLFLLIEDIKAGFDCYKLVSLNDSELKAALLRLKGVGEKVANCIMLFGYYRIDGFPIDTWIKKVLIQAYDLEEKALKEFAENYFSKYGGIAQQYLFYYGRYNL